MNNPHLIQAMGRSQYAEHQLYYVNAVPRAQRQWTEPYVQLASFDPAEVNLGIRIERRHVVVDDSGAGRTVALEPLVFSRSNVSGANIAGTLVNLLLVLNNLKPMLAGCHVIVIERQLFKKNPDASRIFQHILTWLLIEVGQGPLCPDIYEVDPKWVKQMMSLRVGKGKGNKTIIPYRVRAILFHYRDIASWQQLAGTGKKDDVADSFAQLEAICRTVGLPHLIDPGTYYCWANLDQVKTYLSIGACRG